MSENEVSKKNNEDKCLTVLIIIFWFGGALGVLIAIATLFAANIYTLTDPKAGFGSGVFGDAFGFTTSIFTGSAFLGLAIATALQRKELAEVRAERKIAQLTLEDQIKQSGKIEVDQRKRLLEDRVFRLIEVIQKRKREILEATWPVSDESFQATHFACSRKLKKTTEEIRDLFNRLEREGADYSSVGLNIACMALEDEDVQNAIEMVGVHEFRAALFAICEAELLELRPLLVSTIHEGHWVYIVLDAFASENWDKRTLDELDSIFLSRAKLKSLRATLAKLNQATEQQIYNQTEIQALEGTGFLSDEEHARRGPL